jgi:hypothetical protein
MRSARNSSPRTDVSSQTLWKKMSPERRLAAAEAFWADGDQAPFHAEAIGLIARQKNFRPRTAAALPAAQKARALAAVTGISESLASRLLVSYHLTHQRPMMGAFLDALEIPHEDGLITAEEPPVPDAARLRAAAARLTEEYPREDVALYLATLAAQDPETWRALEELAIS